MSRIKVYTAVRMTGRYQDEMVLEAEMLVRVLGNYGLIALNPVLEERIKPVHEILPPGDAATLLRYWKRDKELIRESDVLLDYDSCGRSDGVNNEVGYSRWCLWKPTVRVWLGSGGAISRMEDDLVAPSLVDAINVIQAKWGTYEKLREWHDDLWDRSFPGWWGYQKELAVRYSSEGECLSEMR